MRRLWKRTLEIVQHVEGLGLGRDPPSQKTGSAEQGKRDGRDAYVLILKPNTIHEVSLANRLGRFIHIA
jgi:hypothetical protein